MTTTPRDRRPWANLRYRWEPGGHGGRRTPWTCEFCGGRTGNRDSHNRRCPYRRRD